MRIDSASISISARPSTAVPDKTQNRVRLKQREIGNQDWDTKLTLRRLPLTHNRAPH
jgi:hypothetical protein